MAGYSKVQGPGVSHDVVEANKKEPKKVEEGRVQKIKETKMSKERFEAIKGLCIMGNIKVKRKCIKNWRRIVTLNSRNRKDPGKEVDKKKSIVSEDERTKFCDRKKPSKHKLKCAMKRVADIVSMAKYNESPNGINGVPICWGTKY